MTRNTKSRSHYVEREESLRRRAEFIDYIRGDPRTKRLPMSVRAACDKVGVSRNAIKNWRQIDESFAEAYEDAMEDGVDILEDEATRRAVDGHVDPVYQGGELVGSRTVYSDDLLKFIMSGRRSRVYGRAPQINVQNNTVIEPPSDRDLAKALSLLIEETKQKQLSP